MITSLGRFFSRSANLGLKAFTRVGTRSFSDTSKKVHQCMIGPPDMLETLKCPKCRKIMQENAEWYLSKRPLFQNKFLLNERKVTQLQPGLILIKQGLSLPEQVELTQIAIKLGEDNAKGFWKTDQDGQRILNQAPSAPHRGRIFDALANFPPVISQLCETNLRRAQAIDASIKLHQATHLILLYYQTLTEAPPGGYIPWHQDKDPNDGDEDKPVISFTLGDSCDFLVCNAKPQVTRDHPFADPKNLAHRILFESGDVLLFGGPSRAIHHSIYKIHKGTSPIALKLHDARLNFTFRYTPDIKGKEELFSSKNFTSVYHHKN